MKKKIVVPVGTKYGRLTVIEEVEPDKHGSRRFKCVCECGSVKTYKLCNLRNDRYVHSCGCARGLRDGVKSGSRERLYKTYINMKQRCDNPNVPNYYNYGGRGISVCEEWEKDYNTFRKWAYEAGYKQGLTLDRIDNNGNYGPTNCRWVNMKVQSNNTRKNIRITYNGETHTPTEWSDIVDIPDNVIRHRYKRGFPLELVFSKERLCEARLREYRKS